MLTRIMDIIGGGLIPDSKCKTCKLQKCLWYTPYCLVLHIYSFFPENITIEKGSWVKYFGPSLRLLMDEMNMSSDWSKNQMRQCRRA